MNKAIKFRLLERLNEELDDVVWPVFDRYIKIHKINFNSPDGWRISGGMIDFYGQDGCRGCYDNKSISIPMRFFEDPEAEFAKLEQQLKAEEEEKRRRHAEAKLASEKAQYLKLREKFGQEDS